MISALDLFSIGIGPSSSHTVGPMRAARRFAGDLEQAGLLEDVARVRAELFGSLGATGRGHGTDKAVILGLAGEAPESVDPDAADRLIAELSESHRLRLANRTWIGFDPSADITLHLRRALPGHPNGITLTAYDAAGALLHEGTYYSIGGGFIVTEDELRQPPAAATDPVPYPFSSGDELVAMCQENGLRVSELVRCNERTWRTDAELDSELGSIWQVMQECVANGCRHDEEILPGGLQVRRRAPRLYRELSADSGAGHASVMEWVDLYALAVNEENAAGRRMVTEPTNGAAGIIPAVLHYYMRFVPGADQAGVIRFLLAASAIGILIKTNASISGAEVGCQGEVGSACSMAAAGLAEALGATPAQVEHAAEIGIEHNLGLTCDPVGGLVQIPCIERNAIASNKAINAALMALRGDGTHRVSLDQAIRTMRDTGADMMTKYKETSEGGLAVNVVLC